MTDARRYRDIARSLGVPVSENEPLAGYTTMKIGGPARWLFVPRSAATAARLHAALREETLPVRLLGAGSNLLVVDEGVQAAVIATHDIRGEPRRLGETRVQVMAGAGVPGLVRWAAAHGLAGLEFAEGIPAKLGGAIRMNAGANGAWFEGVLESVLVAGPTGGVVEHRVGAGDFAYRESFIARERLMVLGAVLALTPDDPLAIRARIREFRERRRRTQPLWQRSAGCVFANWPDQPVGALVDRLGLKGMSIGDAQVSRLHGNFIVNRGDATAADVLALIESLRDALEKATGQRPRLEVEIWKDET